jgi:hypothetical protein
MSSSSSSWQKELRALQLDLSLREHPFTWLEAYWAGYQSGYAAAQNGFMTAEQIAPPDFHQFVSEHFGRAWPNAKGWRILIREHTASEREAFELFFQLRNNYETRRTKAA